jgi:hypothetical protein
MFLGSGLIGHHASILTASAIYKGDSIIVTGSPTQEVLQAFRDFGLEFVRRAETEVEGYDRLCLLCPLP